MIVVTVAKLNKLGYELLVHLLYSPDLAPIDNLLFSNLKQLLLFIYYLHLF